MELWIISAFFLKSRLTTTTTGKKLSVLFFKLIDNESMVLRVISFSEKMEESTSYEWAEQPTDTII